MKNDQPLDYRLRVATKRTDLPEDVIRLLADAYYEIWLDKERVQVLQDKCDSLLSTNVELEVRIKSIKEGFEGCCTACEPVGEINKKLREELDTRIAMCDMRSEKIIELTNEIERLRKERDEARREAMSWIIDQACRFDGVDEEYKKRGWEYLKENTNYLQDLG